MSNTDQLRSMGLKVTGPRLKILALFEHNPHRHLSADDVSRMLMAEDIDVGLATVYRVLTQFEQAGLLVRHHFDDDRAVYELNQGGHHDHVVCLNCGQVEEFLDKAIERRQQAIAEELGFKLVEHSLHLYAECARPNCPNRKTKGKTTG
jgi:Fur family ferric uptake transcriptional regulator